MCFTTGESQGTCNTYMLPPSVNKAAHFGFETQRRHHQKSKTGVSVGPRKGFMSSKNFFKRKINFKIEFCWIKVLVLTS